MAGILSELDSVASFITQAFPSSAIKYDIPNEPKANTFVIRTQSTDVQTESRMHVRIERTYQLIFYSDDVQTAFETMDRLSFLTMDGNALIPLNDDSLRYIRVESFSFGNPLETESGLHVVIGVMPTQVRTARTQEIFAKIAEIGTRYNT